MKRIWKKECDVLVVGAGVSGICAALSSARAKANTILIEKNNFFGGTAITGMFSFICGLYLNGNDIPRGTLNKKIIEEICSLLNTFDPGKKVMRLGKVFVLPFSGEHLISAFKYLVKKTNNLAVHLNSELTAVKTDRKSIIRVTVKSPKGIYNIFPRAIIDCSGKGRAIELSGAEYRISEPNKRQSGGFIFKVKGLKNSSEMLALQVPYLLNMAVSDNKIPQHLRFTTFVPGNLKKEGFCKLSVPFRRTRFGNKQARGQARLVHRYLARNLDSFEGSYIAEMSPEILEREGIRGKGEYILSAKDVIRARKFIDGVVKNSWPIEFWSQDKGPQVKYLKPGAYYEIPLRCLKSKNIANLFFAGRCISVSSQALASTRMMGTCMSLGEQAGLSAAGYIKNKR